MDGGHVASRLLDETYPQTIRFAVGPKSFKKSIWQFHVLFNDMDGGWVVKFGGIENRDVFDALRISDEPFSATVAGVDIDLTPREVDRRSLQRLASACATPPPDLPVSSGDLDLQWLGAF